MSNWVVVEDQEVAEKIRKFLRSKMVSGNREGFQLGLQSDGARSGEDVLTASAARPQFSSSLQRSIERDEL